LTSSARELEKRMSVKDAGKKSIARVLREKHPNIDFSASKTSNEAADIPEAVVCHGFR
jgi:hypothetical protein